MNLPLLFIRIMRKFKSVCLFCGSSSGNDPVYVERARKLAELLIEKDIELIYGGGNTGLMGTVADAMAEGGGKITGIIPAKLKERERAHGGVGKLIVVETMHERKALMESMSEAIIVLPGGIGTLDEFCEIMTWNQLRFINKPTGILNVAGYFDDFLHMLDNFIKKGFLQQVERDRLIIDDNLERLLDKLLIDLNNRSVT